jgi:hypothetical protein
MRALLRSRVPWIAAAGLIAGSLAAAAAAQPIPSASVSGSASAAPAVPPPAPIRGADVPTESSDKPSDAEWRAGKRAGIHRGATDHCELTLVREWLRVICKDFRGGGLVAGDSKGVSVWTSGDGDRTGVQFPLIRGTSRIVTFVQVFDSLDYGQGTTWTEAGTMSVVWRDGDADPVIGIYEIALIDR